MNEAYKPKYHFSPSRGWINDPNGLVYFRGEYHMFYQYHPNPDCDAVGAFWGHAVSKDLLRWKELPPALVPGEPYDKNGCWSGTAVVKNDRLYVLYTGYAETEKGVRQTQCLARSDDGENFVKYEGNPVIGSSQLPKGASKVDFRDPEAFWEDGELFVLIGSHTDGGVPQCLLYKTADMIEYEYVGVAAKRKNCGTMWECPNVVGFGDERALILSPQWFPAKGNKFTNVSSTVYGVGRFDKESGKFRMGSLRELDGGCDFYATRCIQLDERTPVMTAWLQMWGRRMIPLELGHGWSGAISLSRILGLKNGKITQKPVDAVYDCLTNGVKLKETFCGEKRFKGVCGTCVYLDITARSACQSRFSVRILEGEGKYALLTFDMKKGECTFDRTNALYPLGGNEYECENSRSGVRTVEFSGNKKRLRAEIFIDKSTVEVFINDGEATTSNLVFNVPDCGGITFVSEGEITLSVKKYDVAP
ncbi:MAG: glycoside hydrolase family 32 protein [Candidatus Neoclostridium sp.]